MTQDQNPQRQESLAEQKEKLLLQCRAYRSAVGRSRKVVRSHLGADEIARTAIGLVSARAQTALANVSDFLDLKNMSGAKLQRLLPLLVSGVSLLSRRSLLKPVLRGAAVIGTAAAAVYFLSRKKSKNDKHVALHEHL